MERGLRVVQTDKNFFVKITNTINKLLIPTKVGFNGFLINIKRNALLKAYEAYEEARKEETSTKKDATLKKYEDSFALYLESIDKYIMDSIYKKVKNKTASEFEKTALENYYGVTQLKEDAYTEYKYRKQEYLISLDYENVKIYDKEKAQIRYEKFYVNKINSLYKGILKHYSVKLADNLSNSDKNEIYEKIFMTLDTYITDILPIRMKNEDDDNFKNIINEYQKFDTYTVGKLDKKEYIEKRMLLLAISRNLFTHSLPLVVAEQCYIKLLKDTRNIIVEQKIQTKKEQAYEMLLDLIENYNMRLLSTKIYWEKPQDRDEYKEFWKEFKKLEAIKEESEEKYQKQREILFIRNDLKKLNRSKKDYSKIIKFYKAKLVELGVMREFKNSYKKMEANYSKNKEKKEAI